MPPIIKDPNRLVLLAYPRSQDGYSDPSKKEPNPAPEECRLKANNAYFTIPFGGVSTVPIPYRLAKYHISSMRFWGKDGGGGNGITLEIREITAGALADAPPPPPFDIKTATYGGLVVEAERLGLKVEPGANLEDLKAFIKAKSK
jgi:hypothetical protein